MAIRLKSGFDVWECDCGNIVVMGKKCHCGKGYGDILTAQYKMSEKSKSPKRSKYRAPAKTGSFIESFIFKKKGNG